MSSFNRQPSIVLVGVNHRTAPVEVRERLAFSEEELPEALGQLCLPATIEEGLILSTCNRVEVYGVSQEAYEAIGAIKGFLAQVRGVDLGRVDDHLYALVQPQSVRHLLRVASGLDSMVIGETEILGQVKRAYHIAFAHRKTKKVLNTLLQRSFHVAKQVRAETGIGRGACSVSTVAVELAEKIFSDLSRQTVMVIGAGEMGMQAAKYLKEKGVRHSLIANRSLERAQGLAQLIGGAVVPWEALVEGFAEADIVISSASAPGYLVEKAQVVQLMRRRRNRSIFFIDIAVPRNIDPSIHTIDNVYVYDIDDLSSIVQAHLSDRLSAIEACQVIIDRKTEEFMAWLNSEAHRVPEEYADLVESKT